MARCCCRRRWSSAASTAASTRSSTIGRCCAAVAAVAGSRLWRPTAGRTRCAPARRRAGSPPSDAALAACEGGDAYYVGHNVNPFFSFAMATFAYELIEALGPDLPEHLVMPVGGGSLYVGNWLGLRLWLGPDARLPRLHLAQPTG